VNGGVFYWRHKPRLLHDARSLWKETGLHRDRPSTEHWFLEGSKAKLACGPLLAVLDVERPTLGLQKLQLLGENLDGWLMAVDVREDLTPTGETWPVADVYTRGHDLVATYREPAGQPFHLQVYWRVLGPAKFMSSSLEAIVSIQTREWEAYPFLAVTSALDVSHVQLDEGGVNFLSRHDWSYVEASPQGDFEPSVVEPSSELSRACWSYGKRFMERGVIRRLRLRGAFPPIANAEDAITQLRLEFASEPPPLTA
jgi:hypothetical protein